MDTYRMNTADLNQKMALESELIRLSVSKLPKELMDNERVIREWLHSRIEEIKNGRS